MKVQINGTVVTMKTGISATLHATGRRLVSMDEKNNEKFLVSLNQGGAGVLSTKGITANAIVDGELAVIFNNSTEKTVADIKANHGDALVVAEKEIPEIIARVQETEAALDAVIAATVTVAGEDAEDAE